MIARILPPMLLNRILYKLIKSRMPSFIQETPPSRPTNFREDALFLAGLDRLFGLFEAEGDFAGDGGVGGEEGGCINLFV